MYPLATSQVVPRHAESVRPGGNDDNQPNDGLQGIQYLRKLSLHLSIVISNPPRDISQPNKPSCPTEQRIIDTTTIYTVVAYIGDNNNAAPPLVLNNMRNLNTLLVDTFLPSKYRECR